MQRQTPGAGIRILAVLALAGFAACADEVVAPADGSGPEEAAFTLSPPAPAGLVTVAHGGNTVQLWPFTGRDLAGSQADPMNMIFTGEVDVVSLRSALMALDGDRTTFGFPNMYPFNCTWSDAFGDIQTAYSDGDGWVANPVQLQCGSYDPVRFHLRLFEAGPWVLGGAHFELLISGTTEHQVLSWELAETLVMVDMLRTGLVDPGTGIVPVPNVYPAPSYREIIKDVYNGMLGDPAGQALLLALGYPLVPQAVDYPLPADGVALIVHLSARPSITAGTSTNTFTVNWDGSFLLPRPFCAAGPYDVVTVLGPVLFQQRTQVGSSGELQSEQTASGELLVTPFDVFTGTFGEPFRALIRNKHISNVGPMGSSVQAIVERLALPPAVNGSQRTHLNTSPNGGAHFTLRESCG